MIGSSVCAFILASCVGSVQQTVDGAVKVNLPMMARADKFAVNASSANGNKLKVYVVNGNAEAVPIEGFRTAAALGLGLGQLSVTKADNASNATTLQQSNAASAALAKQKQADATALELAKLATPK